MCWLPIMRATRFRALVYSRWWGKRNAVWAVGHDDELSWSGTALLAWKLKSETKWPGVSGNKPLFASNLSDNSGWESSYRASGQKSASWNSTIKTGWSDLTPLWPKLGNAAPANKGNSNQRCNKKAKPTKLWLAISNIWQPFNRNEKCWCSV